MEFQQDQDVAQLDEDGSAREQEDLIEYLNKLRHDAETEQPSKNLRKFSQYYSGRFSDNSSTTIPDNNYNVCKPIVETKATLILDSMIGTSVSPSPMSALVEDATMEDFNLIADILTNCQDRIFILNKFTKLKGKVVRDALKYGVGIIQTSWDPEMSDGIGDVAIDSVNPEDFFPDPAGKTIDTCNYIFIRRQYSSFTLKKKYPDMIEQIDQLINDSGDNESDSPQGKPKGIVNGLLNGVGQQIYSYGSNSTGIKNSKKNITAWECYLVDDSPFLPNENDDPKTAETKQKQFKYPYGRCIVYSGKTIFDDKPISYPFGFPFDYFNDIDLGDIWGQGEIEDQTQIQDRINRAWTRIASLVREFLSCVLFERIEGFEGEQFPGAFAIPVPAGTFRQDRQPRVLTNNTLSELKTMLGYVQDLEVAALNMARLNKTMLTGERQQGVTSGQMVNDLNESPMASIRGLQRNYAECLVGMGQKIVTLVQMYYKTPRLLRISEGKKLAQINPNGGDPTIVIWDEHLKDMIKKIQGDLSLGQYEVNVIAGSDMPKTKGAAFNILMNLADKGYLGDTSNTFVRSKIIESSGLPHGNLFISHMIKEENSKKAQPANVASLLEKLNGTLADLSPSQREYLLTQLGFPATPPMEQVQDQIAPA